jgi:hypothetical protein
MEVTIEKDSYWIWNVIIKIAYFFLANIRNSLLMFSGIFFVYIFFVVQIYFQEKDISLIEQIFLFLNKIPFLSTYFNFHQEDKHFDGEDLKNFLIRFILVFTVILEILKYIKNLIFGKPEKKVDYNLKKHIIIAVILLTFLHLMSVIFLLSSKNTFNKDFGGFIFMILAFWIMHTGATLLYLCFDFIIFEFQKAVEKNKILKI